MKENHPARKCHYLRTIKKHTSPTSLLFVNTLPYKYPSSLSVRKEVHRLRLWSAYATRLEGDRQTRVEEKSSDCAEEFWKFVASRLDKKRNLWIFLHNAGYHLTLLGFWELLSTGEIELVQYKGSQATDGNSSGKPSWRGFACLNDPPTIVKCRLKGDDRTIVIVDTVNYWKCELRDLADSLGHKPWNVPHIKDRWDIWADYCRSQLRAVVESVTNHIKFVRSEKLGAFSYTAASQAYQAYRARFLKSSKTILISENLHVIKVERESYLGGANQQFFCGEIVSPSNWTLSDKPTSPHPQIIYDDVYVLDVQSFYPSMMRYRKFPCRASYFYRCPSLAAVEKLMDSHCVIARVHLDCQSPGYIVRRNGKVFRATGRLVHTLCTPELKRAMRNGEVRVIGDVITYEQCDLFSSYVDYFWEMKINAKRKGDKAKEGLAKLYLNSLYGKFGQRRHNWEDRPEELTPDEWGLFYRPDPETAAMAIWRSVGNMAQCQVGRGEHPENFPAISAHVCAYGRERLWDLMRKAGKGNYYYCDTDSLHCNEAGYKNLVDAGEVVEGELGRLSLKGQFTYAHYRGAKDLTLCEENTISGIKKDAKEVARDIYQQREFQRIASIITSAPTSEIMTRLVDIDRSKHEIVGVMDDKGWIRPPILTEW